MTTTQRYPDLEPPVHVPDDETPAAECPYCEWPFSSDRAKDLHLAERHADRLTEEEVAAMAAAREAERDDLFLFHIKAVVALGVLYSSTVILYMVAIQSGLL